MPLLFRLLRLKAWGRGQLLPDLSPNFTPSPWNISSSMEWEGDIFHGKVCAQGALEALAPGTSNERTVRRLLPPTKGLKKYFLFMISLGEYCRNLKWYLVSNWVSKKIVGTLSRRNTLRVGLKNPWKFHKSKKGWLPPEAQRSASIQTVKVVEAKSAKLSDTNTTKQLNKNS